MVQRHRADGATNGTGVKRQQPARQLFHRLRRNAAAGGAFDVVDLNDVGAHTVQVYSARSHPYGRQLAEIINLQILYNRIQYGMIHTFASAN